MKKQSVKLGKELIERETELEAFFRTKATSEQVMIKLVAATAEVRGQLRATHLKFHLQTPAILTNHQIKKYQHLRGYSPHAH
ncbi:MAG: hypothetical protein JKY60_04795 [Kordiimonadaceae bacterium]|nr:hypothetical protein [Kordiimonadaceae bacterium]